ncbi:MAG: hypothetical protein EPN70_11080 [Paraburkholderia sp.]|uniref:hypothetical protein n=1 Tax=Paraburkholderia sp. TaxID=1926495 RepID=UPI00120FB177|nr:hypothetical protein [Paraburkholderia sp.]TAM04608.1 MAG: hypothetical protein EPN70_11080 [Paraburkholderia sp.]TAM31347.1 MAG: hypothetical protein EPN59_06640 [Paraburkholderia sp.]
MKPMTLLARGIMVSLPTLALLASLAPSGALAQPPRAGAAGWPMPRVANQQPNEAHLPHGVNAAVPRGNLRGDIVDNARQRAATQSRPEPPAQRRR